MTSVGAIIPCFRQGAYLPEAVACVLAQGPWIGEIVVVDDGSPDDSTRVVLDRLELRARALPVPLRIVRMERNAGLPAARNEGIRRCRAEIILPLDADDLLDASYVERVFGSVADPSRPFIAYSKARAFGLEEVSQDLPAYSPEAMRKDNCIFASALFRRADWEACGGYSEDLGALEDYDFWIKLLSHGARVSRVEEELFFYRRHACSLTAGHSSAARARLHDVVRARHPAFFARG